MATGSRQQKGKGTNNFPAGKRPEGSRSRKPPYSGNLAHRHLEIVGVGGQKKWGTEARAKTSASRRPGSTLQDGLKER